LSAKEKAFESHQSDAQGYRKTFFFAGGTEWCGAAWNGADGQSPSSTQMVGGRFRYAACFGSICLVARV
jgi:hypothetical protein